ncbi:PaaI family thioesterase [Pseudomonas sp. H9]|uniref:PaaI family thioesterase n=1 Tax=Pseudomonas sp. H9 TaxID=483968 RepID=UPI001057DC9E|nr:PaaI family thioesterase [Pseudomonas sp. H9]TDF80757.1 PaaI family thioesterase [Pseudomonas sp. H9]
MNDTPLAPTPCTDTPPDGFQPMPSQGFVAHCWLYQHTESGILGTRIRAEHLNPLNIAHGGLLATLADTALGRAIFKQCGATRPFATVSLSLDYLHPACPGHWIEAHTTVHKIGQRLSHASVELRDKQRVIARGKAIFTALTPDY